MHPYWDRQYAEDNALLLGQTVITEDNASLLEQTLTTEESQVIVHLTVALWGGGSTPIVGHVMVCLYHI